MRPPLPLLLLLVGCAALEELTPVRPVLSFAERSDLGPDRPSGVRYTGPPVATLPVPPLQVWGLTYELDLVLRSRHPSWDMHELVRVTTPDGALWLAKDARASDKEQSIVGDLPDAPSWLPEVPVPRKDAPLRVEDHGDDRRLDLRLAWETVDGEQVEVAYRGRRPERPLAKRNANTMGHSAGTVMAALDLSRRALGRAEIHYDGARVPLVRLLGLVPFSVALAQTQAGLSVGRLTLRERDGALVSTHASGATQTWALTPTPAGVELAQHAPLRTLRYGFRADDGETLELAWARVEQYGQAAPPASIRFLPALPDARRPFEGRFEGAWVLDVGGQPAHAVGTVRAWWDADGPVLELRGDAPAWVADRPLRSAVRWTADGAEVAITRSP